MLPAPGRFSTITGTRHLALSRLARKRATASTVPPASNGATILTVRSGYSAAAGPGAANTAAINTALHAWVTPGRRVIERSALRMFQNGSSLSDDVMRKNRRGRNVPTDPTRG